MTCATCGTFYLLICPRCTAALRDQLAALLIRESGGSIPAGPAELHVDAAGNTAVRNPEPPLLNKSGGSDVPPPCPEPNCRETGPHMHVKLRPPR